MEAYSIDHNHATEMAEEQFAVTITALHGQEATILVTRFLGMVFKNRTPEEISSALHRLPLLITSDVSRDAAEVLRRHLEARGATVLLESYTAADADAGMGVYEPPPPRPVSRASAERVATPAPATSASTPARAPERVETAGLETSYSYSRPGRKDRIFIR